MTKGLWVHCPSPTFSKTCTFLYFHIHSHMFSFWNIFRPPFHLPICLLFSFLFFFNLFFSLSKNYYHYYYFGFVFFLLLLIKQLLFSHETVKVSRLFCLVVCFVLFLELNLQGNNPQLHYFSPVPKRFTIFFIYFRFNIILYFILNFTLFFTIRFIMDLF